jgi:hypothetical protein
MATGATIDCPLLTQNQQSPKTTQVVGRIQRVVNGVIRQFEGKASDVGSGRSIQARIDPRDGFTPFSSQTYSPLTGASGAGLTSTPTLLIENGVGGLVGLFDDVPGTFSSGANAWEVDPRGLIPSTTLSTLVRYTGNTKAQQPDSAAVGNAVMTAWVDAVDGVVYEIQDTNGSVVLLPTVLGTGAAGIVKVVADGSRFWLFAFGAAAGVVVAIDVHGAVLGTPASVSLATSGDRWDVTYNGDIGVRFARPSGGAGVTTSLFTWNGTAIVQADVTDNTMLCGDKIAQWLTNTSGSNGYLATVDGNAIHVWRVTNAGTQNHQYDADTGLTVANLLNLTGSFINDGTGDVLVAYTVVSTTDDRKNVTHASRAHFSSSAFTATLTQTSLSLVSRAFQLESTTRWYAVGYYPSGAANGNGQPCFYLMNLNAAAATGVLSPVQVVGRFDYLLAWGAWNTTSSTYQRFQLSSPYEAADATTRVALNYRAESFTTVGFGRRGIDAFVATAFPANTVGVKEYVFTPSAGEAFTFAGETLIPGPLAVLNSGPTFSEANVNQAPEPPTLVASTAGGSLTPTKAYQYVVVFEGTNNDGSIWRSLPTAGVSVTLGATDNTVTLTGLTCFVSQRAKINISIYRTSFISGVATTNHYKVTNDLSPTLNNTASATWTFVDTMSDTSATSNEILYTDQGFLDRYPAPAFSMGLDWQLREWVIGYDGAVWFSGLKTDGDAVWFNPLFRVVLPSNEKPVSIAQVDSFMLIFTASSIWQIQAGGLPDDTGANGSIPVPTRLPFANGSLGHAKTIRDGVLYDSSAGGAWCITRDLRNVFIGAAAQTDFQAGAIRGIAVNSDQRAAFLLGTTAVVWDSEASAWTTWALPASSSLISTYRGQFVIGQAAPNAVWSQIADSSDDNGAGIPLTLRIAQCDLGGVRNFKRCWATQFFGEYMGDHDLEIDMFLDDDTTTPVASWAFTPDSTAPYLFELAMPQELISNVGFEFRTLFPRGASGGAAFESLAFYVGLEKGLNKLAIARRIAPT